MPDTGGSYEYLQKAFGPLGIGRLMGFLFLWQVMLAAPLTAASGGVGFADYTRYLIPSLSPLEGKLVAMGVCLFATFLLYRDIKSIGKISNVLWAGLMLAIGIILWGGVRHFNPAVAFNFPTACFRVDAGVLQWLGRAALLSMYDYSGYFNVCLIGGEVENPTRTIPRVVVLSIVILAVLYVAMSLSIIGVVPWQEAVKSTSIVSDYMERIVWHAGGLVDDAVDSLGGIRFGVLRVAGIYARALCGGGGGAFLQTLRAAASDTQLPGFFGFVLWRGFGGDVLCFHWRR